MRPAAEEALTPRQSADTDSDGSASVDSDEWENEKVSQEALASLLDLPELDTTGLGVPGEHHIVATIFASDDPILHPTI
jgi:hypothetical protein